MHPMKHMADSKLACSTSTCEVRRLRSLSSRCHRIRNPNEKRPPPVPRRRICQASTWAFAASVLCALFGLCSAAHARFCSPPFPKPPRGRFSPILEAFVVSCCEGWPPNAISASAPFINFGSLSSPGTAHIAHTAAAAHSRPARTAAAVHSRHPGSTTRIRPPGRTPAAGSGHSSHTHLLVGHLLAG